MTQCEHGKKPGDTIEIGDMLGSGIDPSVIVGRVCGFIKDPQTGQTVEVLYRRYRTQEEPWPTGDLLSRRWPLVWAHQHLGTTPCTRQIRT